MGRGGAASRSSGRSCVTQLLDGRGGAGARDPWRARAPRRRHQAGQGHAREHVELERRQEGGGVSSSGRATVSAVRNPASFGRHYVLPDRVVPAAVLAAPAPSDDEAMKALLLQAARSHGVGSARCLADYHRLNIVTARRLLAELADDGALRRGGGAAAGDSRPSCTRTPCSPAGCVRPPCSHRSTRSSGSGPGSRRCSASATASRSTCPPRSGCTATTSCPSSTTASSSPGSTSRPIARPGSSACRAPTPSPPSTTTSPCRHSSSASESWRRSWA